MYSNIWMVFVNITAQPDYNFIDLLDLEDASVQSYIGAFANVLIKADTIHQALDILPKGLAELNFKVLFIDKIENFNSLVEYNDVSANVIEEADWLRDSTFVFKISDKLFPYVSL